MKKKSNRLRIHFVSLFSILIGSEKSSDAISIGQCHILNQANENIFDQLGGAEK